MIAALSQIMDRLRGSGAHAITTPPMDGALQPNQAIEEADLLLAAAAPDNLIRRGADILFSTGKEIRRLGGVDASAPVVSFDVEISALAASPHGALAVGLVDGRILIHGGGHDGFTVGALGGRPTLCPTALLFDGDAALLLCLGSRRNAPCAWKRDLMQRGSDGSVWRVPLDGGEAKCLADGLAYPNGLLKTAEGRLVVSESWRNRLVEIKPGKNPEPVLSDLPGYPARLAEKSGTGGAWLAVFAPRSQLIEFVLRERDYCEEMIRDIAEDFWIAPSLKAPHSFLEPLQGGGLKQLGIMKPWAPTRSFGLVLSLDSALQPVASWHSRADGTRHGITSCIEDGARLVVAARGGDALLSLAVAAEGVADDR